MEATVAMNVISIVRKHNIPWSFLAAFFIVLFFGFVEIEYRAPLSIVTQLSMLALFLIICVQWLRKDKPEWILYLYICIQPMTHLPIYVLGSIRLSFILLGVAVLCMIYIFWKKKSWREIRIGKLIVPQIIFVGTVTLSTVINVAHIGSFERIVLHISNALFVLALLQLINSSEKLLRLFVAWCGSLTFLSLFGIAVSLYARFRETTTSAFIQTSIDGIIRISSLTPDSNYFAVLLLLPLSVGLAIILSHKVILTKAYRAFFWFFVPLAITTILLTYSRAGLIALAITLFAFVFFEKQFRRYEFWLKIGIILGASLILCVLIQPEFLRNMILRFPDSVISQDQKIQYGTALTFDKKSLVFHGSAFGLYGANIVQKPELDQSFQANIADDAIDVRGLYWGVAWKMFQDKPIFGVGAGQYSYEFEKYLGYSYFAKLPNTHNIFLETLAEFGVIGFLALLYLLVRGIWLVSTLYRFATGTKKILLYALAVAYVASMFQYTFQPSFNSINLWLILGIIGVIELMSKEETQKLQRLLTQK